MSKTNLNSRFAVDGFVFQKSFQSPAQVAEILENLQRVIADIVPNMPPEHVFYEDKNDTRSLKQLQELHRHDDFFGTLIRTGPFRQLAEQLMQGEVVCKNLQYFNKPPRIGKATPAHQDGYYFKLDPCEALTMWLALEPVDEETGCVRYVPGSHRDGMRPHGSTGTLGFSQGITDFPTEHDAACEVAFPAEPGDLLAHHALTIHRADGNSSQNRSRRAMGLIYYRADAKEDESARAVYQSQLKSELTRSGKI